MIEYKKSTTFVFIQCLRPILLKQMSVCAHNRRDICSYRQLVPQRLIRHLIHKLRILTKTPQQRRDIARKQFELGRKLLRVEVHRVRAREAVEEVAAPVAVPRGAVQAPVDEHVVLALLDLVREQVLRVLAEEVLDGPEPLAQAGCGGEDADGAAESARVVGQLAELARGKWEPCLIM